MAQRASGILLHPTALPGPFGIGDLGPEAYRLLDWLEAAGQSLWQVLPLGPTGLGNSPYDAASAFAGNPWLVAPEELADLGLLSTDESERSPAGADGRVDFTRVGAWKSRLLSLAWNAFRKGAAPELGAELEAFCHSPEQRPWLEDWVLYDALKSRFEGAAWNDWPQEARRREPAALAALRRQLDEELALRRFAQFLFFRQWSALRREANRRGIRILGDMPIYVALDSADVWAHPELFDLDADGRPRTVAGVPPDYFSSTGQRWGNPIYRWDRMAADGYSWWIERLRLNLRLADVVRIDHFRGFAGFWAIDGEEETAVNGSWREGPGLSFFEAVRHALGDLPLVAEDLGLITEDVRELRRTLGLPGMRVLQFGFESPDSEHLPHHYDSNLVVYTGTHDNDTAVGWFTQAPREARQRARDYLGSKSQEIHWGMIRALLASVADWAVFPIQDLLGLGSEARFNCPGTVGEHWSWRLESGQLTAEPATRLRRLVELTGRLPEEDGRE